MKTKLLPLMLFICASTWAAGVPEKHPTDSFQIGVGSSSSQKNFLFDLGLGASNPTLGVDTSVSGLNYSKNVIQFGDGTSSLKSFIANVGSGSANPKIVWSSVNSDWEFSNDGTNFTSIGSGSGGASGVQLLDNGGYESGITLDWTNTGGTFSAVTTGANLLIGKRSATFTASAGSQSVQSGLHVVPIGLQGQACAASMMYKGGDNGLTFEVLDNSSNILASQVLQTAVTPQTVSLPFLCPSSGSIRVKVLSSTSAALVALDQMFLGSNNLSQVSQATLYGTLVYSGSCSSDFSLSSTTVYTSFPAVTGCTVATTGNVQVPPTQLPGVYFPSLPPGHYVFRFSGVFTQQNQSNFAQFRLVDGTNLSKETPAFQSALGNAISIPELTLTMDYATAQSNLTIQLQAITQTGATVTVSASGLAVNVYRFPTQSELAVRPETINWVVDAQLTGAGNTDLGLTNKPNNTVVGDSSLVLTPSSTSASIQVGCTGSNPPTGTTCSAGTPEAAWAFNVPASGKVRACVSFSHFGSITNGSINEGFQLVETPINDDSTVLQTPSEALNSYMNLATTVAFMHPVTVCSIFNFQSSGKKMLRLVHASVITGTVSVNNIINDGAVQNRNISFHASPLTQNLPAPVFVGSVMSSSAGVEVLNRITFNGGGSFPSFGPCTSSPCNIQSQSGSWVTSVTHPSPGTYVANLQAGVFSSAPTCTCSTGLLSAASYCAINQNSTSSSAISIQTFSSSAGAALDEGVTLLCQGQK